MQKYRRHIHPDIRIELVVDWDGDGDEAAETYNIDFTGVKFESDITINPETASWDDVTAARSHAHLMILQYYSLHQDQAAQPFFHFPLKLFSRCRLLYPQRFLWCIP